MIQRKLVAKLNKIEENSNEAMGKLFAQQIDRLKENVEMDSLLIEQNFKKERENEKLRKDLAHLFYLRIY